MPPRHRESAYMTLTPIYGGGSLLETAAAELEEMRCSTSNHGLHPLPPACHEIILSLSGNQNCIDCGASHPDWTSVSYGAMLCLRCSGTHRSLGVQVSEARAERPRRQLFFSVVIDSSSVTVYANNRTLPRLSAFLLIRHHASVRSQWTIFHMRKYSPCWKVEMRSLRNFLSAMPSFHKTSTILNTDTEPKLLGFIATI